LLERNIANGQSKQWMMKKVSIILFFTIGGGSSLAELFAGATKVNGGFVFLNGSDHTVETMPGIFLSV
jgi:hypothetical protein